MTKVTTLLTNTDLLKVQDSTKIKCYMECPRKYFFEYVLHWRSGKPNKHLEFGIAWHLAKEALLLGSSVEESYALFLNHYRLHYAPQMDLDMRPKDPGTALIALEDWAQTYKHWLKHITIMYTEVSGQTPLFAGNVLTWKIDAIIEDERGIWALDHKTASVLSSSWIANWALDIQMKTYIHALVSVYGNVVSGAIIDGTILQKSGVKQQQVKVMHTDRQMNQWFWNTNRMLAHLENDFVELSECDVEDEVLMAFPQNPQSCSKWGLCQYHTYCSAWSNPSAHECPSEFTINPWNPLAREGEGQGKLKIEEIKHDN